MAMSRFGIVAFATEHGWEVDRYRNMKKIAATGKALRLKFQKNSVRLELQFIFGGGRNAERREWRLIRSAYYSKLSKAILEGWPLFTEQV